MRDVADRRDLLREHLGDLAANHQLDDFVARNIRSLVLTNESPVAEDRHLVGDLEQLVHFVGDVDDARALGLERADDPEQVLDLAFRQRRGWLIHDQDVGIVRDGLGDLDHLPVGDREVAHFRFRIEGNVEALEQLPCAPSHLLMAHEAEGVQRLAADPDVLSDGHVIHQVELLMDHGDAVLESIEGRRQLDLLPLQFEGAGIGRVDPGDDLHQRRLARAVLAHERMDVTALQPERHVVEREHAGEGLPNVRDLKQVFGARNRAALPDDFRRRWTYGRHGAPSNPDFGLALCARPRRSPTSILARDDPEALGGLASPGALGSPKRISEPERHEGELSSSS